MVSRLVRAGAVVWALFLAPAALLHADSLLPNTHAVLVGVSTYPDAKIKPRQHAEADVKALYDVIVAKDRIGADPKNVHLLLGKKEANSGLATRANILSALESVVEKAGPNDLVLFAFFGQGGPLGTQLGFFGTDATVADRTKTALDGADIAKKLENLKSARFCAFIDINLTDFENSKDAARDLDLKGLSSIVMGDEDLPPAKRPKGRAMFLASNGLTATIQLERHSLFGQTLLNGMEGKADKYGDEEDGLVMVNELVKYMNEELPREARTLGKTKDEKSQRAIVLRNPPTNFAISRTPKAAPVAEKRLDRFKELIKSELISKDVVAEGERFLGHMPRVKYQQELRKQYQKLADGDLKVPAFLAERARIEQASQLPRKDAMDYASRMQTAFAKIDDTYFKQMNVGELASGAIRGLYQFADEPIPAVLSERLSTAKNLNKGQIADLLTEARLGLHRREDLDAPKAEEATLTYLFTRHLDKYSQYVEAETVRGYKANVSGNFTGIGIQVRRDPARDMLVVVTPIKDSPAYKAGVKTGDWIREIRRDMDSEGNPLDKTEVINGVGVPLEDAIKKIVGLPGTKVKLSFERQGVPDLVNVEITRARITAESLFGAKRNEDDSWDFMLDPVKKIGYARIGSFTDTTHVELLKAIATLKNQGMKAFILDLRFCPGGKLNTALRIGDQFINDEKIVGIKYRGQAEEAIKGTRAGSELAFPMGVLINGSSASASELVSACWQDHKRATIIGERTYGKGTVVTYSEFKPTGGLLNLTTATFWRPSGKNLEKIMTSGKKDEDWGVKPDLEVPLGRHEEADLFDHLRRIEIIPRRDLQEKEPPAEFRDIQLQRALEEMREQSK